MAKELPKKVPEIPAEAKGQPSALYAHRLKRMILRMILLLSPILSWGREGGWGQRWH